MFSQSDLTLRDFDKVEGCEIDSLKDIANSESQMQFLEVLSNSQQFIAWLQKETKGEYLYMIYMHAYKDIFMYVRIQCHSLLDF